MDRKSSPEFSIVSPGVGKKPYPSCAATHSFVDGILDLVKRYDIQAEEVASVECGIFYRHPKQFSKVTGLPRR